MGTPLRSKIHKTYTPKTLSNKKSIFRKTITNSPNRATSVCYEIMVDMPETFKNNFVKRLEYDSVRDKTVEASAKVIQNVKNEAGQKSFQAYEVMNALSENFQGQSTKSIQKKL